MTKITTSTSIATPTTSSLANTVRRPAAAALTPSAPLDAKWSAADEKTQRSPGSTHATLTSSSLSSAASCACKAHGHNYSYSIDPFQIRFQVSRRVRAKNQVKLSAYQRLLARRGLGLRLRRHSLRLRLRCQLLSQRPQRTLLCRRRSRPRLLDRLPLLFLGGGLVLLLHGRGFRSQLRPQCLEGAVVRGRR